VFEVREASAGAEVVVGSLRLGFGAAVHPVPALLTAVAAQGRRLVYSGDTGPGGDLEELASGADVLLCEATYQGEPGPDRYPYHLFAVEAGAVAAAAGVARLLVTHVAPGLEPGVSIDEAAAAFDGEIGWAAPGLEVMV
jgi:ribonuclease BN (tRNA processing enzyme)